MFYLPLLEVNNGSENHGRRMRKCWRDSSRRILSVFFHFKAYLHPTISLLDGSKDIVQVSALIVLGFDSVNALPFTVDNELEQLLQQKHGKG